MPAATARAHLVSRSDSSGLHRAGPKHYRRVATISAAPRAISPRNHGLRYGVAARDVARHPAGRKRAASRTRLAALRTRLVVLALMPLVMLIGYVALTAELAAQTYRLNADQSEQAQLVQETDELHQRLAQLQSVSRLEAAAAALHMREPATIAVVTLPATANEKPTTTAFAAGFASFKRLFAP